MKLTVVLLSLVAPALSVTYDECRAQCLGDRNCEYASYQGSECYKTTGGDLPYIKPVYRRMLIGGVSVSVEGMIAFWPLTEEQQGQNLVPGGSDVQLQGVVFTGDPGPWRSLPAEFLGSASSYISGTGDDLVITGDFSFMAAVYLEVSGEGPLLNYQRHISDFGLRVWISGNRLYWSMQFPTCPMWHYHFTSQMTLSAWQTVALSVDHSAGMVSMWVDGVLQTATLPECSEQPLCEPTVYMGKWPDDGRAFTGKITCMSVYNKVLSYEEMFAYTMPICKA